MTKQDKNPRRASEDLPFARRLQLLHPNCWNPWLNPTSPGPGLTIQRSRRQQQEENNPHALQAVGFAVADITFPRPWLAMSLWLPSDLFKLLPLVN